jgi:hypothetical protein
MVNLFFSLESAIVHHFMSVAALRHSSWSCYDRTKGAGYKKGVVDMESGIKESYHRQDCNQRF